MLGDRSSTSHSKGCYHSLSAVHACHLALSVNARNIPVDTTVEIVCNPALTEIYLFDSPITDPLSVSTFLDLHFPSTTTLYTPFNQPGPEGDPEIKLYQSLWVDVGLYLWKHDLSEYVSNVVNRFASND